MTDEEGLGGPIAKFWHFPFLSRLRERETSSIGSEGAINRALERAPQVFVKHIGRATGQTAADLVGNAVADGASGRIRDIFKDRPLLGRREPPPAAEKAAETPE